MDNVNARSVIRQMFSLLPICVHERLLFDHYTKKLTTMKAIFVFIAAQLNHWSSYSEMEFHIAAQPELQRFLRLERISGSQLSRKLDQIPTELLNWLFHQLVVRTRRRSSGRKGITAQIGKLRIIDSSRIRLPLQLGDWARMSTESSGVKMHLRLVADSPETLFPDALIPTSLNVDDRAGAIELVTDSRATYVMDRGYEDYNKMDQWIMRKIRFVMRIRDRACTSVVEEFAVPEGSPILRDARVRVGSTFRSMEKTVRLVEFQDEQNKRYRVLTSIWHLSAEEIAYIYKSRWLIELYFKWLKQHLRLTKLHSYKPQAIWNQMLLALITALLVEEMKQKSQASCSTWRFLQLLRAYMYHPLSAIVAELNRPPGRISRGKPPGAGRKAISVRTTIGIINPSKAKK
ncbi:hypothetical protein B1A99_35025 [Cohnella sp. CIP 111063]|uniref:IS4 family transposase n=1 Tax=unclassified Cohnella TaxID=2636738 RepID=UPI000B8C5B91|nr:MULTISPECIES: IS4 family transposase [unclassified Cohnella]OXS52079.1 hypothetical protein B1A99_35025 [Cohnella sp. CIP 111063]PRX52723.1 IS4 family transposase [Cohnella sp. SGD-V74]